MTETISGEIASSGAISFARCMELALYHPEHGYYERAAGQTGRHGDFYTSVSVGSLFGELLASGFARWAEENGGLKISGTRFQIVEAGAHDGRLALDILHHLREQRPELFARVEYWMIEPSRRRQAWQQETLKDVLAQVRWFGSLTSLPSPGVHGVMFANELLDAFPVHRLSWDARQGRWFEWGVNLEGDKLAWVRMPTADECQVTYPKLPAELLAVLPNGFTTEVCPAAEAWWASAASMLRSGRLMTLDYGLSEEDFYRPERAAGTLRAYRQHQVNDDLLANPGEQDLTAHVNFTALQRTGERAGLTTETFCSQSQFLTGMAEKAWQPGARFGEWTPARTHQFQTLTHPEHLGRAFKVLVQRR